jgi:hypothetical protein
MPPNFRVALVSGSHLCSNPRAVKEADALSAAGFEVVVLGGAYVGGLKERDLAIAFERPWTYEVAYDLTRSAGARLRFKLQRRLGLFLWDKLGLANRWQIFYGTGSLRRAVRRLDADLTIAHWEAGLPAVLAQLGRGGRVGIDMEDWFSEDLLPSARVVRPVRMIAEFEETLLRHGVHSSCPSEAMADALVARHGCRRPVVIRNVFPRSERASIDGKWKDRPDMAKWSRRHDAAAGRPAAAPVSIHWFSQTIGPGRGLEEFLKAAGDLSGEYEIHLRGDSEKYAHWLATLANDRVRKRLRVHPMVGNDELLSRIAEHDVGFAGEHPDPPSRDLTITNKFLQYLQGGLAVVASATAGQKEGAREAQGAVSLYSHGDSNRLREALQRLIHDRAKLTVMRAAAWEAGGRLCWENEAPRLVEAVEEACGNSREA